MSPARYRRCVHHYVAPMLLVTVSPCGRQWERLFAFHGCEHPSRALPKGQVVASR